MEFMFSIFLEIGKVQVTWIEALAFVLALACVVCNVLEIHWGWPLAIVSSGLYFWLFVKNKLYGDAGIQIYFVLASVWGWWLWLKHAPPVRPKLSQSEDAARARHNIDVMRLKIRRLNPRERLVLIGSWIALWLLLGKLLTHFTDSDVAWADAFPTAGSLLGQILLGKKIIENWIVWQVVNVSMVLLLAYKSLWLTMLLYIIFLAMAVLGWRRWSQSSSH
jgi:nicotinamide mononucleotide transporter